MTPTPKHGGCFVCKTLTAAILHSIPAATIAGTAGLYSVAVCAPCKQFLYSKER